MNDHLLTIDIKVPRERVWQEITKIGRLQRALMNTVLESDLVPGSKLRYYSPDRKRHAGWTDQVKTHKGVVGGWRKILAVLKAELETGDIPLGTKITYRVQGALMFLLPKRTKTEEVAKSGW
jgi:uncharacterized protein YndB with AHSA1/START domain